VQTGAEDGAGLAAARGGEMHGAGVVGDHGVGGMDGGETARQIEFGEDAGVRHLRFQRLNQLLFDLGNAVGVDQFVSARRGQLMETRPVGNGPLFFYGSGAGVADHQSF